MGILLPQVLYGDDFILPCYHLDIPLIVDDVDIDAHIMPRLYDILFDGRAIIFFFHGLLHKGS